MTAPALATRLEVPVVWLAPRPSAEATHALEQWARARGIVLRPPLADRASVMAVDPSIVDRIEAALEEARRGVAALDGDVVARALSSAEEMLASHPELPQAAWLRAEVLRAWSARWARVDPKDPERAAATWQRAAALDGSRAPGIGETAFATPPAIEATLVVEGALPSEPIELYVDGARVAPGPLRRAEGEHQIVALHERGVAYAQWLPWSAGGTLTVVLPAAPACSVDDLGTGRARSPAGDAPIRCAQWLAATPLEEGVRVSTCRGDRCDAAETLLVPRARPPRGGDERDEKRWPVWITWTAIGAGAVALTGVVLWAAGTFDGPERSTRFVSGGVREAGAVPVKPLLVF